MLKRVSDQRLLSLGVWLNKENLEHYFKDQWNNNEELAIVEVEVNDLSVDIELARFLISKK